MLIKKIGLIILIGLISFNINLLAQKDKKITKQIEPKLEKKVLDEVNSYRASKGLKMLTWSDVIMQQAREHSAKMAEGEPLKHQGFKTRISNIEKSIPYRSATENVAKVSGDKPEEAILKYWLDDLGSSNNLIENYNLGGVGIYKTSEGDYYATLILILSE